MGCGLSKMPEGIATDEGGLKPSQPTKERQSSSRGYKHSSAPQPDVQAPNHQEDHKQNDGYGIVSRGNIIEKADYEAFSGYFEPDGTKVVRSSAFADGTTVWILAAIKSRRQRVFFSCGVSEARAVQSWFQGLISLLIDKANVVPGVLGSAEKIRCVPACDSSFMAHVPSKLSVWTERVAAREAPRNVQLSVTAMLHSLRLRGDPCQNQYRVISGVDMTGDASGSVSAASAGSVNMFSFGVGSRMSERGKSDGAVLGLKSCFRKASDRSELTPNEVISLNLRVQTSGRGKWATRTSKAARSAPQRAASQQYYTTGVDDRSAGNKYRIKGSVPLDHDNVGAEEGGMGEPAIAVASKSYPDPQRTKWVAAKQASKASSSRKETGTTSRHAAAVAAAAALAENGSGERSIDSEESRAHRTNTDSSRSRSKPALTQSLSFEQFSSSGGSFVFGRRQVLGAVQGGSSLYSTKGPGAVGSGSDPGRSMVPVPTIQVARAFLGMPEQATSKDDDGASSAAEDRSGVQVEEIRPDGGVLLAGGNSATVVLTRPSRRSVSCPAVDGPAHPAAASTGTAHSPHMPTATGPVSKWGAKRTMARGYPAASSAGAPRAGPAPPTRSAFTSNQVFPAPPSPPPTHDVAADAASGPGTGTTPGDKYIPTSLHSVPMARLVPSDVYLPATKQHQTIPEHGPAPDTTTGSGSPDHIARMASSGASSVGSSMIGVQYEERMTLTPLFLLTMQGRGWDGLMRQAHFVRMVRNMIGVHHLAFVKLEDAGELACVDALGSASI